MLTLIGQGVCTQSTSAHRKQDVHRVPCSNGFLVCCETSTEYLENRKSCWFGCLLSTR